MPGAALRRRPERARLAARARSLPRTRSADRARRPTARSTTSAAAITIENVDLTQRILELLGKPESLIRPRRGSPGPRPPLLARHDRSCESLGWQPQVTFEEGLAETVEWYQRQRMVVAADQGRGRGVPEVLPGPVRHADLNQSTARQQPDRDWPPLVTGATGFAGSHLLEHLLETEPAVAAWSNPAAATAGRDRPPRALARGRPARSRRGPRRARRAAPVGRSITAPASRTSADRGRSPTRALRVNVLGTHHLLEGVRTQASTARPRDRLGAGLSAVGGPDLPRTSPIGPSSPYGVSKLAQEMLAFQARRSRRSVARPFNHAGPRQTTDYVTSAFARQIAEIEAGSRRPVLRVGNLESRRDITDVRDIVRAYRLLVRRGQPQRPYNVCSGTRLPRRATCSTDSSALSRLHIAIEVDRRAAAAHRQSRRRWAIDRASSTRPAGRRRFRSSGRSPICSTTGGNASAHRRSHDLSGRLRAHAPDRPRRDGRVRAAAAISHVVAGRAPGGRSPRIQLLRAADRRRSTLSPGGAHARVLGRHPALSAGGAPAAARLPRAPRHRRGGVGHPRGRRRHGHDRRHARAVDRASRGTATRPSPDRSRYSCSGARRARSWRGGAGRR